MPKFRVHARVSEETGKRLREHCLRRRKSIAAIVETALREHLDGTGDPSVMAGRFEKLDRAVAAAHRDIELHLEVFASFIPVWYAHTPPIAPDSKAAALQLAQLREREFVAWVARRYGSGRRFRDDVAPSDGRESEQPTAKSSRKT